MKRLDEAIKFYLTNKTKYSIMITGEWGTGKTYYFKHVLKPMAEELPSLDNKEKKYKIVMVSLFGVKSIGDIESEIFATIYSILKNKYVKIAGGVAKGFVKLFAKTHGADEIYESATKSQIDRSDWTDLSNVVLCFDDLERMSSNLKIEEFIGYVNNLVENERVKVIIIADEPKIIDPTYKRLKEKVIGNTIEFLPDFESSYLGLIKENFETFGPYYQYLTLNKDFVIDRFKRGSTNLRILELSLIYFHQVYSVIEQDLIGGDVLEKKKNEILFKLLAFVLAITTEYQEGRIDFKKREQLDLTDPYEVMAISYAFKKSDDKESVKPYRITFADKYFENDGFSYYRSIYDFITGGASISYKDLIEELRKIYHVEDNEIPEEHQLFKELVRYDNIWNLSDKDYNSKIKKLLDYSDKGVYDLSTCLSIFWCATRFNNPLGYNLDKLESRVIKGMGKSTLKQKYNWHLKTILASDTSSFKDKHSSNIRAVALDFNEALREAEIVTEYSEIEEQFYSNFEAFESRYYNRDEQLRYGSFFQKFNPKRFFRFFMKSDNSTRRSISNLIYSRYHEGFPGDFKSELDFIIAVQNKIKDKLIHIPNKGRTGFIFHNFSTTLDGAIKQLTFP